MINDDPSHINTIRTFLEEIKKNYCEKYGIRKLIIGADGDTPKIKKEI